MFLPSLASPKIFAFPQNVPVGAGPVPALTRLTQAIRIPSKRSRRGRPCACPNPPHPTFSHSPKAFPQGQALFLPSLASPKLFAFPQNVPVGAGLVPVLARLTQGFRIPPKRFRRGRPCSCPVSPNQQTSRLNEAWRLPCLSPIIGKNSSHHWPSLPARLFPPQI